MLPSAYYGETGARRRQIDTLTIFNDHVTEITENSEYRVDFTSGGSSMSLTVVLGPDFPIERPGIYVNPPVPHPWVAENSNQVIGAPGLLNYTSHSDLGRVVQAIIREFQTTLTPYLAEDKPEVQSALFPELNDLSVDDLQEILENTDIQDKLLENNPQLVKLDLETEELINSIECIAQDNIEKQGLLDSLKTDIINRISAIVQMKMNYEELNHKHQMLADRYDPHRLRDCLKDAALKADEDAEVIAEQFLHGQMPVETFISEFAEKRALGQARRAREERLGHQLTQLHKAT